MFQQLNRIFLQTRLKITVLKKYICYIIYTSVDFNLNNLSYLPISPSDLYASQNNYHNSNTNLHGTQIIKNTLVLAAQLAPSVEHETLKNTLVLEVSCLLTTFLFFRPLMRNYFQMGNIHPKYFLMTIYK